MCEKIKSYKKFSIMTFVTSGLGVCALMTTKSSEYSLTTTQSIVALILMTVFAIVICIMTCSSENDKIKTALNIVIAFCVGVFLPCFINLVAYSLDYLCKL
ncbi:hypothetical protein [Campylobacter majalis]|uniref:hypothetical protein n=1 Tax=Campylobacter majalis TaxID=2790656 RepID=UPI003D680D18